MEAPSSSNYRKIISGNNGLHILKDFRQLSTEILTCKRTHSENKDYAH